MKPLHFFSAIMRSSASDGLRPASVASGHADLITMTPAIRRPADGTSAFPAGALVLPGEHVRAAPVEPAGAEARITFVISLQQFRVVPADGCTSA
jgi:hypothetical protein